MTHRFFLPPEAIEGQTVTFTARQAHQLRSVLRLRPGAAVTVLDDSGLAYDVELTTLDRDRAVGRVCARRPVHTEPRLSLTPSGNVRYQLTTPYRGGTTRVIFEPLDFMARLAVLVPRPRVNLTRYHGVFAPNSQCRALVTKAGRGRGATQGVG